MTAAIRTRRRPDLSFLRPSFWLPLVLMMIVLGLLWQWGAQRMPYLLPPLGDIGATLVEDAGYYLRNAYVTLREALGGLVLGGLGAFVIGVLVSEFTLARRAIMPVAVILNVTPLVAIAPALVVAFGFGAAPKLIVTGLICFFPVLINTSVGLRAVPLPVLQVYRTVHASRLETLWYLRIPSALPYLFAALRIVFPLSVVGAVVAELSAAGSSEGLGTAISLASSMNRLSAVYASIAILAVLGSLLLLFVTLLERRLLHWHETQSAGK
ncbi:ABC transporter permease [Actinoplanes derwentensis]|uniref:NitT/TauT family transport system permease protein n=1 Tax=Actinoplanes derwentensis TaxID=113562 RepID=A0A1H2DE31_9ACTN|nr:ABC transporter permease subunit [Actinoplanes derwentensis]GID84819.1 nitrate ABC transporter permease [Actinoplanes derwentensis]SDT81018.1 NitT/TauT family transport system permease protein [Actinoplanes derwentensis]